MINPMSFGRGTWKRQNHFLRHRLKFLAALPMPNLDRTALWGDIRDMVCRPDFQALINHTDTFRNCTFQSHVQALP